MRCGFQLNRRLAGGADTAAVRVEVEGGEGRVGDWQPDSPGPVDGKRLTNCTVSGDPLFSCGPSAGREFGDSIERKIGQAREHRTQVISDR